MGRSGLVRKDVLNAMCEDISNRLSCVFYGVFKKASEWHASKVPSGFLPRASGRASSKGGTTAGGPHGQCFTAAGRQAITQCGVLLQGKKSKLGALGRSVLGEGHSRYGFCA